MCDCNDGIILNTCPTCSGSGEGNYSGSTCWDCRGKGVKPEVCEECEAGAEVYLNEPDPLDYL